MEEEEEGKNGTAVLGGENKILYEKN